MKTLTVFTPTYNRAYILKKCYDSLKNQTSKDFIWLIIDDGSSDNTKEVVKVWIDEGIVEIRYYYQENKGMHGAHNTAYSLINTEINTCIDSDDYMPLDAVKKIVEFWNINKKDYLAGFAALDSYDNGQVIGSKFPKGLEETTYFDMYHLNGIKGDKKLIYKTELTKKYPYPIFEGEKYVSLAYKYAKLDEEYKITLMNEVVCIVEYLQDGSSKNMLRQYRKNPKGFAFIRLENLKNPKSKLSFKFKECVHYVSSSIMARDKKFLSKTPLKIMTIIAMPIGIILYTYIMKKTKEA
ncbi:MAG: glycosyltransferase family 2 protein [Romboutsia sp.]